MKASITRGISGSGKSTWTEEFLRNRIGWLEINRDNIRFKGGPIDWTKYKFTKAREQAVTDKANQLINYAAINGLNIICSDTNLNEDRLSDLIDQLETLDYEVEIKDFEITFEEAMKRDAQRSGGVGTSVLMRQWLQRYGKEPQPQESSLPPAYIFDIDGTIAKMQGRSPFEWHRVGEDKPVPHVIDVCVALWTQGNEIVFLSGRDGVCRPETEKWLKENIDIPENHWSLFMREAGNQEKDTTLKPRLFEEYIKGRYNVMAVFDDRPSVVRTWITQGIPVFAVGNPWLEF